VSIVSIVRGRLGYGDAILLDGIECAVHPGQRVGLVGPNGSGKTSLLRAIAGEISLDLGRIEKKRDLKLGILRQETMAEAAGDSRTLWQEMELAMREVDELALRIRELSEALARPDVPEAEREALVAKLGGAEHRFSVMGGYDRDRTIARVLNGIGFADADFDKPVAVLSGGQEQKAQLARLLLERPDLLLLDEPNNHLDLDGRKFLEDFLVSSECAVLVVSHDRFFLNAVAQYVWEIDQEKLFTYRGNYDAFRRERLLRIERQKQAYESQREYIERTEEYIRRNIAGQNTRQARGRRKHLARLSRIESVREARTLSLDLGDARRSGEAVLSAENISHRYGDGPWILRGISFDARRGDKIGIIGPNGCGKTTLLSILSKRVKPTEGRAVYGANVHPAMLVQESGDMNPENTVVEEYLRAASGLDIPQARSALARFLFCGEDVGKKIGNLSGGEKRRLALAKLLFPKPNLLLLDEPTNHFDIPSYEMLEAALSDFPGTVIMVSHDRALLDAVCTRMIAFTAEGVFPCEGGYSDWLESSRGGVAKVEEIAAQSAETKRGSYMAEKDEIEPLPAFEKRPARRSKELDARKRAEQMEKRVAAIESEISELELEHAELAASVERPEIAKSADKLAAVSKRMDEIEKELGLLYDELDGAEETLREILAGVRPGERRG
jgi:ATP-binding cassette subfamily F protein 3